MRTAISVAALALLLTSAMPAVAQGDRAKIAMADSVLAELERLPDGLRVTHTPNPVRAVEDSTGSYRYTWKYATTVSAMDGDVTIVEFGTLGRVGDIWVYANYTGKPFGAKEFAAWYGCDEARLRGGESFSDPTNWTASGCLRNGTALWYFIAEDGNGRRVKGSAEISQVAEVAEVAN